MDSELSVRTCERLLVRIVERHLEKKLVTATMLEKL